MLLTVTEAANLLQVSEKTVFQWIKKDELPACKVSDAYRLNRVELLEWATEHQIKLSPELFTSPESSEGPLPFLSDALAIGGIHYDVAGKDKQTVLHNVVGTFQLPPGVDRDFLLQVLLAREALGTTAIGDGIAIPHVRNPILLHVSVPAINLCFLANPINFAAMDGKPVRTLFTLISPSVQAHLHLLSRLAYALRDHRFKEVLNKSAPRVEIMARLKVIEAEIVAKSSGAGL